MDGVNSQIEVKQKEWGAWGHMVLSPHWKETETEALRKKRNSPRLQKTRDREARGRASQAQPRGLETMATSEGLSSRILEEEAQVTPKVVDLSRVLSAN